MSIHPQSRALPTDEAGGGRPTRRDVIKLAFAGAGAASLGLPMFGCEQAGDSTVPSSYRYDVNEAAKIDPALIKWREVEVLPVTFVGAIDLASGPAGELVVAVGREVHTLNLGEGGKSTNDPPQTFDAEVTAIAPPRLGIPGGGGAGASGASGGGASGGVAMTHRIVSPTGAFEPIELGEQAHVTSLQYVGDDLYIADAGNRRVLRILGGDEVWRIDDFQVPSPYFDVALLGDRLWVANTGRRRLEAYDLTGEKVAEFGEGGMAIDRFCGCCNPCHFVMLADGRFVAAEKGLHRVKVLKPDGTLDGVLAGPDQLGISIDQPLCYTPECSGPAGPIPAALPDGRVAVIHPVTGRIHLFEEIA